MESLFHVVYVTTIGKRVQSTLLNDVINYNQRTHINGDINWLTSSARLLYAPSHLIILIERS